MPDLPSGVVTFVFTDIEGSTGLLRELGAGSYADALAQHRRVVRAEATRCGGVEVDTQGDAFFLAFANARRAFDEMLARAHPGLTIIQREVGYHESGRAGATPCDPRHR